MTLYNELTGEMEDFSLIELEAMTPPDNDALRALVVSKSEQLIELFEGSLLGANQAQKLLWQFVNGLHNRLKGLEREINSQERALRELLDSFASPTPVSGIDDDKILSRQASIARLNDTLDSHLAMFEAMQDVYDRHFHAWEPPSAWRSAVSPTAAMVDARAYLANRQRAQVLRSAPAGKVIAVIAERGYGDRQAVDKTLDTLKAKHGEIVLALTDDPKANVAVRAWANRHQVTCLEAKLDKRLGKRAAFARNETMLSLNPIGVLGFGKLNGIGLNLLQKAQEQGIRSHRVA